MKLPQFMNRKTYGNERPRAPQALLYVPPQGAPVHCPSLEAAQRAAENYSAENPGRTVAVYQLFGYCYKPIEPPEFVMATSDEASDQLLECTPGSTIDHDDGLSHGYLDPDRPDLTPEQREELKNLRQTMRENERRRDNDEGA